MITARTRLPILGYLEGSLGDFDRFEAHSGLGSVAPTIEAVNVLCADWIEEIFNILIDVEHGVMTESVRIGDHNHGGRVVLVMVARKEEVDGKVRIKSWNLELVQAFRLEKRIFESADA